jgi:hypothetical protein
VDFSFHQGFDLFLEGLTGFLVGRDDEDGIVTRNGSGNFREFSAIDGGSQGLCAARRRFQNEKIFCWSDIEKKFAEGAGERGQRRGLFG